MKKLQQNDVWCGAEIAAWEPPFEMERFDLSAGQEEQGGVSLVVDFTKNIRECPVGGRVAVGHVFRFSTKGAGSSLWVCRAGERRSRFEEGMPEPLETTTAILPGSKWSVLLFKHRDESVIRTKGVKSALKGTITKVNASTLLK